MTITDAFSVQIVELVRKMPGEAILELVKQKLGALGVLSMRRRTQISGHASQSARAQRGARAKRGTRGPKRRTNQSPTAKGVSAERQRLLDTVEHIVKAGSGMSASDVSRSAGIPQTRAAAALKELKCARCIFQGGDRRFARYAGDAKTAEQASLQARKSATGPTAVNPKKGGRGRRRSPLVRTTK
jgi:hypothetical protein